jgi:hypothetical protein
VNDLFAWWNLVYVLAFFLAFLYVLLSAIGLASGGGGMEAHMDAHLDAHAEVGGGTGADGGVGGVAADHDIGDVSAEAHVDAEVHAGVEHAGPGMFQEALSLFGVGQVPLSVVMITFLLTFSVVGWSVNLVLSKVIWPPAAFFAISLVAATLCGLGGSRLLAGTLGRWLRPIESAAIPRYALVGTVGTACLSVTEEFGNALVHDPYGTQHKVVCRVPKGAAPIAKGQTVLLVRYVHEEFPGRRPGGYYLVESYTLPVI